eukprot:scaffold5181_cov125-Isochrysis_galbana.AAC.9
MPPFLAPCGGVVVGGVVENGVCPCLLAACCCCLLTSVLISVSVPHTVLAHILTEHPGSPVRVYWGDARGRAQIPEGGQPSQFKHLFYN